LVEAWKSRLGDFDDFAAYRPRQQDRAGLALLLLQQGRPLAFVKARLDPDPLTAERNALQAIAAVQPRSFSAPTVLDHDSAGSVHYLALSPMPPRIHRIPRHPDLRRITDELQEGLSRLPRPADVPGDWLPMHGDFTPWNLRLSEGRMLLFDWEATGWGPPAADVTLYRAAERALRIRRLGDAGNSRAIHFWIERTNAEQSRRPDGFRRQMVDALREMERTA
jgi:hypothetical protein